MANILIAGCGYVGGALARARVARGDNVFGLRRNPVDLPSGVVPIAADLAVPRSLAELPGAIDVVVYAASPGGRDDAFYRTAYVEGLRNLIAALAAQRQRPRRTIFVSSTAVYGHTHGEWVDETSPTQPSHFSGRRLLEAESVLRERDCPPSCCAWAGSTDRAARASSTRCARAARRSRAAGRATPTASTGTTASARSTI
jgi:nucleoside-diphosphate-sugar epimerase